MFERNLLLKYLSCKDNFLYVNPNLKILKPGTCVRLIDYENNVFYFSIANFSSELEDNCIGISSLLAKTLRIEENVLFRVTEVNSFSSVKSLAIFPVNQNEYEVIESLADNIQQTLLNQIRVVCSGQCFVIWIGNNINATVSVGNINPVSPGAIDFLTEVHIEPITNHNLTTKSLEKGEQNTSNECKFWNIFSNNLPNADSKKLEQFTDCSELIFRVIPFDKLPINQALFNSVPPFTVFLSKAQFPEESKWDLVSTIFSVRLLTSDIFAKDIYIKLMYLEDIEHSNLALHRELYVSQDLLDLLDCDLGSRVIIKPVKTYPIVSEIEISCNKNYNTDVLETFKMFLANDNYSMVLNSNIPIDIGEKVICSLKFLPNESKFCAVDDNLVRNCKYTLKIDNIVKTSKKEKSSNDDSFIHGISNLKQLIESSTELFSNRYEDMENILIIGKPGTGKSTLLKHLAKTLQDYPYFNYVKLVSCKTLKGKTMDSLGKFFSQAFSDLLVHEPSVLVLDDLHIMCENIQGDEASPNYIYFSRISEMLHTFFKSFSPLHKIGILASCESVESLNKNIYSSRGSHLFKNIEEIKDLTKQDRLLTLKHLLRNYEIIDVNFNDFSIKTEGFVIQDLVDFSNKTIFEMYKNDCEDLNRACIKQEHLESALKNTSIISLQNVQLHSPGDKDFSSIGGLHSIKKILMENLLWPGHYPNIFANAPIRLQSGLLLYGPPGSGKTLLAGAAAKECGMRLISVKGPELLSKYIGASEQSVRDIFQKAQSARPCILFFDEFDSLAPKRGHDNTGVTDRVVNQLLTQLDGVEALVGVCVLAATSRPDLLDSALLRPGRLDKQILCALPNEAERLEILKIHSCNLSLDDDVDLSKISVATENYSGADLQSMLYTAHMLTMDYSYENDKVEIGDCKITQNHLEEALKKTKPSLSHKERVKYEKIYKQFQTGSTLGEFKAGSKATLA
ncbi:unnamed protein product [Phyllotreta striolata]|uniref:Peroxisomal ATPase PEX1 n=1 Tax=Phyllotreta striolata TaxID=444603 RepID=A0A9N9TQ38_PHYSR|nr:unnamed protein product [Phyllotreta striolata]